MAVCGDLIIRKETEAETDAKIPQHAVSALDGAWRSGSQRVAVRFLISQCDTCRNAGVTAIAEPLPLSTLRLIPDGFLRSRTPEWSPPGEIDALELRLPDHFCGGHEMTMEGQGGPLERRLACDDRGIQE